MKKGTLNVDEKEKPTLDSHKIHLKRQVDITFDENTKFVRNSPLLKFTDALIWAVASAVLPIVNFSLYGVKYKGRENIREAKRRGKGIVTIANHCMIMDSPMCASIMHPKPIYLPTVEETLKIPKLRFIIKALRAIPIPKNARGLIMFGKTCESLLRQKKAIHFFPEGSLWPWYKELRPFKSGAFRFAVNADATILPLAITFRPRRGVWKLFGKKPLVTITALPPLTTNKIYRTKPAINDLLKRSFDAMSKYITPAVDTVADEGAV